MSNGSGIMSLRLPDGSALQFGVGRDILCTADLYDIHVFRQPYNYYWPWLNVARPLCNSWTSS